MLQRNKLKHKCYKKLTLFRAHSAGNDIRWVGTGLGPSSELQSHNWAPFTSRPFGECRQKCLGSCQPFPTVISGLALTWQGPTIIEKRPKVVHRHPSYTPKATWKKMSPIPKEKIKLLGYIYLRLPATDIAMRFGLHTAMLNSPGFEPWILAGTEGCTYANDLHKRLKC